MVTSEPKLLLKPMLESMVLPQPGSVFKPMTHGTTKGRMESLGVHCNLWSCWCYASLGGPHYHKGILHMGLSCCCGPYLDLWPSSSQYQN